MVSISQAARLAKFQDGGVLLDIEGGAMLGLNPVGTRIVELLQKEQSVWAIVAQISRDFAVPEEDVRADVDEFLSNLRQLRLLNEKEARNVPLFGEG